MEKSKVTREVILAKTHYGLGVYAHVLRKYYPGEVVLKVVGRDCGLTRNPFNGDKPTLHVWLHKEVPGKSIAKTPATAMPIPNFTICVSFSLIVIKPDSALPRVIPR